MTDFIRKIKKGTLIAVQIIAGSEATKITYEAIQEAEKLVGEAMTKGEEMLKPLLSASDKQITDLLHPVTQDVSHEYKDSTYNSTESEQSSSAATEISNEKMLASSSRKVRSYAEQAEAELLCNQGNISARMDRFEDALCLYERAIALDDSNPMYYNNRAATLKRLGRLQEAIKQYEEIVQNFPDYGKAFLSLGSTCVEEGNYHGAVSNYRRFLAAYNKGQFSFNPIVGGVNQSIDGESPLETAFLTSINYLSVEQQTMAMLAFFEAKE